MVKWKDFENEMTEYLKQTLKDYDISVQQYGKSDSTIPDIEITINSSKKKFYIETKMPTSQTSQFVVEIINNKFVYGKKNKFKANKYSDEIINVLNNNFELYSKVREKGMIVPIPNTIAFSWIASNMKNKNVDFVISIDDKGNKKVFSLKQFNQFFNIKTIFRRKKSGSQNLPKMYYEDFKKHLDLKFSNYNLTTNGKELFLDLPLNLSKKECYIDSDILQNGKKYFLSNIESGKYKVKITSGTNNPNIIFELSLKDNVNFDMFTIQCLIDYINNYT